MRIILLGAPGTGKGTQGELLSQYYRIPKISTGDILREATDKKTELGVEAKKYMQAGELVPDDIMISIVEERLERNDCVPGFILDGFPRTVPQAIALDEYLDNKNMPIKCVIALEVNAEVLIKRLTSRRICDDCGKDYNVIINPPPKDLKCEKCGGEIIQRSDDNKVTVSNRLKVYEKKTAPLKKYYQEKGKLKIFDGDDAIEDVQHSIQEFLSVNDNY